MLSFVKNIICSIMRTDQATFIVSALDGCPTKQEQFRQLDTKAIEVVSLYPGQINQDIWCLYILHHCCMQNVPVSIPLSSSFASELTALITVNWSKFYLLVAERKHSLPVVVRERDALIGHLEVHSCGDRVGVRFQGDLESPSYGLWSSQRFHVHRVDEDHIACYQHKHHHINSSAYCFPW